MVDFSGKKLSTWNILEIAACNDMCIVWVLMIIFWCFLRSFLILETRALDTVGKTRSPFAEIAAFYRLIEQQIHNHLLASFTLVKKTKQKTQPTPSPKKEKQHSQKSKTPTQTDIIVT